MSNYIQGKSFYFCTAYSGKTCQLDEGGGCGDWTLKEKV